MYYRFFRWRFSQSGDIIRVDPPESVLIHSDRNIGTTNPINVTVQPATSSNNVLNKNLSGSFKNDEDSDSDDADNINNSSTARKNGETHSVPRLGVAAIPNTNFNPDTSHPTTTSNNTQYI